jgi:hypothetical protein
MRRIFYALALLLAIPIAAKAETTGSILATVTDENGAPVAGVTVSLRSPSQTARGQTDARGNFSVIDLIPDTYTLVLTKPGYQPSAFPGILVFAGNERFLKLTLPKALRQIACLDCYRNFFQWGGSFNTNEMYVISRWHDPFFDTFQTIDLSTVPAAPAGGGSTKF